MKTKLLTSSVVLAMYKESKRVIYMRLWDNDLLLPEFKYSILGYYISHVNRCPIYIIGYKFGGAKGVSVMFK